MRNEMNINIKNARNLLLERHLKCRGEGNGMYCRALVFVFFLISVGTAWGQRALPYEYGFEDGLSGWTTRNNVTYSGINAWTYIHTHGGSKSFGFSYDGASNPQYLISPELAVSENDLSVQFYYKNFNSVENTYTERFYVGYSTTGTNIDDFHWGSEITKVIDTYWDVCNTVLPSGTKYVAIKYMPGAFYLYLDDFKFGESRGVDCGGLSKLEIGSGDATNENLPSHSFYRYSLTQQIYTAAEIGNAPIINSISFYNTGTEQTRNYDIYLVNTTKSSFTGATDWIRVSVRDKVFSGNVVMSANEWTTISFDLPFEYSGNNLALIMDDNTGTYSNGMTCKVFEAEGQSIYVRSDGTDYDPASPGSYNGTVANVKNQVIFCYTTEVPPPPDSITITDMNCDGFEDATINRLPAGWSYTANVCDNSNPGAFQEYSTTPASVFVIEADHPDMLTANVGPYGNSDNYQSCAAIGSNCLCIEYAPAYSSYCQDVHVYPPAMHLYPATYSYSVVYFTEFDMSVNSHFEAASVRKLYFGTTADYTQMTEMSDMSWTRTRTGWETPIYYAPQSACNSFVRIRGTFEVVTEGDYYVCLETHADAYSAYTNTYPAWMNLDDFCIEPLSPIVMCTSIEPPTLNVDEETDRSVRVSWTSVSNASSYILYYGVNDPNSNTSNVWSLTNATSPMTIPELTNGQQYNFAVMPVGVDPYCPENDLSPTRVGTPVCNE